MTAKYGYGPDNPHHLTKGGLWECRKCLEEMNPRTVCDPDTGSIEVEVDCDCSDNPIIYEIDAEANFGGVP